MTDDASNTIPFSPIIDRFGRQMTYLRVSITDRCNMRCIYCMPPDGIPWQPHDNILTYEEITRVVRVAADHGINEIRLTGGEPLLRQNIVLFIQMLSEISGIKSISLTTNGLLLGSMAADLKSAGLTRVNISLDTLDPEKFTQITRGGSFQQVWNGILAAEAAGLFPIKINMVALAGINEDELLDMARLSLNHPWHIRFIELMPLVNLNPIKENASSQPATHEKFISVAEIKKILKPLHLQPVIETNGSGPARLFQAPGAPGRVGFISPISEHFCATCNRLRLTADGNLRTCLLNDTEISIREAIRNGADLLPYLNQAARLKPKGHELVVDYFPGSRCMRQIGG